MYLALNQINQFGALLFVPAVSFKVDLSGWLKTFLNSFLAILRHNILFLRSLNRKLLSKRIEFSYVTWNVIGAKFKTLVSPKCEVILETHKTFQNLMVII